MADVFVSYKKSDKDRVRPLVQHLRASGLDVWWDEGIQPSMSWRAEIAKQLAAARCVVAVWTQDSVDHEQGQWVMEEATHGLTRRILAPVRLDLVAPPLGFGEVQYADLAAWDGGPEDPRLQHFLAVVRAIVAAEPQALPERPTSFEAPGIQLQNVRMQNVSIHVSPRAQEEGADDEDEAEEARPSARRAAPARAMPSLSMMLTRAIGVILPLIGIAVFVFSMGGAACRSGDAPAFFCRGLEAVQSFGDKAD